jgi:hypothetical protein
MPEDNRETDAGIIAAAYADRVKEAFRAFADNLGMGQNDKTSTDRFVRSLALIRKARDIALEAVGREPAGAAEPPPSPAEEPGPGTAVSAITAEGLSPEVREMIEHAVEQTHGSRKLA